MTAWALISSRVGRRGVKIQHCTPKTSGSSSDSCISIQNITWAAAQRADPCGLRSPFGWSYYCQNSSVMREVRKNYWCDPRRRGSSWFMTTLAGVCSWCSSSTGEQIAYLIIQHGFNTGHVGNLSSCRNVQRLFLKLWWSCCGMFQK